MKKTMTKFISGIAALALALVSFQGVSASPLQAASTYYVSPTGNDSNLCTSAAPCKTFTRALNLAISGDTVIALAGTYNQQVTISKSGITLEGRGAVLDTLTQNGIRVTPTASNVIVRGFTVVHTKSHAIFVEGTNVLIEGNTVYHSILENGTLSNGVITCGNNAWGSGIKAERGSSYVTFRNNISHSNCGEGIAATMSNNVVIEGNTSYDNKSVNIYIDNSYFVKVSNNLSYCTEMGTRPTGIALGQEDYSGWGKQLHDIEISGNTVRDCNTGIMAFGSIGTLTNVLFKGNNIPTGKIFSTGQAFALSLDNPNNLNVRIENNTYFREPWIRSKTNVTLIGNVVGVTQPGSLPTATQTQTPKPISPTATQTQTSKPVSPTATQTQTPKPVLPTMTQTQTPKPVSPTTTQTQTPKPVLPTTTQTQMPQPVLPTSTQTAVPVTATASPTLLIPTQTVTSEPATLTATAVPVTPTLASTETAMPENTVPPQPGETIYDDIDPAFIYSGGWSDVSKRRSYGGSYKETNENGASVTFTFSGTSFSVLYTGGSAFRNMDVYVDDILVGSINQRSEDRSFQLRWDYTGQLEPGTHILKLVFVTEKKKAKVSLDAVIVR